jgi:hypothetical protein
MLLVKESNFRYSEINLTQHKSKDICLYGYFQSYKYFNNNFKIICRIIGIDDIKKNVIIKSPISNDYLSSAVSIHFRLGDYKKIQNYHPIMTFEYYKNALTFIKTKDPEIKDILFFCEEEDILDVYDTINKLKTEFTDCSFIKASNTMSDWEQMTLMSCCKHNIIANSSFSWWAAYLNTTPNKMVCYPSLWFGEVAGHDTSDLCPDEWHKIYVL